MKIIENISYKKTDLDICMLDIYLPDADSFPLFIFFHGGGLEAGERKGQNFIETLINKGVAVISADYRMYPTAVFPDFIEDAAAVVAWANSNMQDYGKVTNIFVGGSSAGGYLSQMLCFDKKYLAVHGIDADKLGGYLHDAGQPTTHYNILRERGIDTRRVIVDEAAPLYHIVGNRDYAPMQIIVSDNDMENRLEQTYLLVSTLKHFEYSDDKLDFRVMKDSTHCSYIHKQNSCGEWIFANMIYEFIASKDKEWNKE